MLVYTRIDNAVSKTYLHPRSKDNVIAHVRVVCVIQVQRRSVYEQPSQVGCILRLSLSIFRVIVRYHVWGVEHSTLHKTRLLHLIITFCYLNSFWITGPINWNNESVYHQSLVCIYRFVQGWRKIHSWSISLRGDWSTLAGYWMILTETFSIGAKAIYMMRRTCYQKQNACN